MTKVIIENPGLLSSVQDAGRYGYQRYGMPVSGAMDVFSMQLANLLVGNDPGAACIEATLIGPVIRFAASGRIALCGAGMQGMVNGEAVMSYRALGVRKGDVLRFVSNEFGCRMYIAFAGGLDVPVVMGSRSTSIRAGVGGFKGRALKKGDELSLGPYLIGGKRAPTNPSSLPSLPVSLMERVPDFRAEAPVRILPGPEIRGLASQGVVDLLSKGFVVSDHSDRMGYRLEGEPLRLSAEAGDIVSAGIAMGTIQVPGSGRPIILMADRQTTGGYLRVAVVASIDLTRVAQLRPGDFITFCEISIQEAQALYRERQTLLKRVSGQIG
ncbi:MAG: biotin-dependent carboxyltransferase family protein [Bacteroidales bacterium]